MQLNRRRFLRAALYGVPAFCAVSAFGFEPGWLKIRTVRLANAQKTRRLLHFTDLHFKGNSDYLTAVVNRINALTPDLVCFTGDLIEEASFLEPTLKILDGIRAPMFGVPGNHDHWSSADFNLIQKCFAKTGGAWLQDSAVDVARFGLRIIGVDRLPASFPPATDRTNIVLVHYPEWADKLGSHRYDLVLAGHSHGGQVRLPFYGPLVLPFSTGPYDLGLFKTKAGPLYVNAGIGCFYLNVRFNCRPELTVIEI